jgi:holin-like protein
MLWSLAVLLSCEALGESGRALTGLPIPAPVIGMALLLLGLILVARLRPGFVPTLPAADTLLPYLPLFFVPPGVGAVMQLGKLLPVWPAVLLGLVGSSILTLAAAGWLAQGLLRAHADRGSRTGSAPDDAPKAAAS